MEVIVGIISGLLVGTLITVKVERVRQRRKALRLADKVDELYRLQGGSD